jgi:hypothetical protein
MRFARLVAAAFLALPLPAAAADQGYNIWFSGRVVSVNYEGGTVRIMRGPTETAGPGIEDCRLRRTALNRLRPGMLVEAQADTRRRPWHILHMRIFERHQRLRIA